MEHQKLTVGMGFVLVAMVAILRPQAVETIGSGAVIVLLAIIGVCLAAGCKQEPTQVQRRS